MFTSYSLFIREKAKGVQNISLKEYMPRLAEEWRALPESERESYRERARVERLQLVKKFDEYMNTVDSKLIYRYNKERRKKGLKGIGRPRSSPPKIKSSFLVFLAQVRNNPEFQTWKMIDVTREGAKQWRALSDAEKASYKPSRFA